MSTVSTQSNPLWSWLNAKEFRMLIGDELVDAADGETMAVVSPRDLREVAAIPMATNSDVTRAVASARHAFDDGRWRTMQARERASILRRIGDLVSSHASELAFLEAVDAGKPTSVTLNGDLAIGAEAFDFFASRTLAAETRSATMPRGVFHHRLTSPVGVVAELLPWNGPLWTGLQRLAAILAGGNSAVIKPAELASLSFLRVSELLLEADLPPGVVNVITGTGAGVGAALTLADGIDLVSHTGGTVTGSHILASVAPSLRRVSFELGGKNPCIVMADVDVEQVVEYCSMGGFTNSGQVCTSCSRILVQRPVYETFVTQLSAAADALRLGDPLNAETELGPLISADHAAKVRRYIELGTAHARVAAGGQMPSDPELSLEAFVQPTVISDLPFGSALTREEIFGPVVTIERFDEFNEAIARANDTEFGLAGGIFTRDLDTAWAAADALDVGQVYINQWFTPGELAAPASGHKHSGYGPSGFEKYCQPKELFFNSQLPG
jgi:aldehyde dehydrogenase (NAD+)